jgi:3-hydroxyisobutyrate dehydrogenase
LFEAMGKRVVHCGPAGTGQAAKVCNNLILAASMVAVSEGFVLAERLGLSAAAMFEVVVNSSGSCWAITANCPVPGLVATSPADNEYRPGFASALMRKDLGLASSAAEHAGAVLRVTRLVTEMYEAFAEDSPGLDFSAIIQAIRAGSTSGTEAGATS